MKEIDRLADLAAASGQMSGGHTFRQRGPGSDRPHARSSNIRGYVPTSLPIDIAIQAMELARAGGVYVPPAASSLHTACKKRPRRPYKSPTACSPHARRRSSRRCRRGKANKIIAYELKMRESTVKVHVRNIMKKLHATNRTEVAYLAGRLSQRRRARPLDRQRRSSEQFRPSVVTPAAASRTARRSVAGVPQIA